MDQVLL